MAGPDLPIWLTASAMTKQHNAGIPGGVESVFDALAAPPETGVAAVEAEVAKAQAVGVSNPNTQALLDRTRNRDHIKDFYDTASVLKSD